MHSVLLRKAFEKAKQDIQSDTLTRLSNHLSDFIQEDSGEPFGEKSLRNHYTAAKQGGQIDLKQFVAESLAHFLNYSSFKEFLADQPSDTKTKSVFSRKHKIIIISLGVVILAFLLVYYFTKQRWMSWNNDHYIEVKFDENLHSSGHLKLFKEERINNFKKVIPDCGYAFFNPDGSVRLWYGKNATGKLEYFTDLGLHPETGKTLKEITVYMIKTHICDCYKKH